MRRIVIWLASTVTVVVLLFGYHTSTSSTTALGVAAATSPPSPSSGAGTSSSAPPPITPRSPSTTARSPSRTPSAPSTLEAPKSYTGPVAQTRWGPVQVKITVGGGKITKVDVVEHPSGNSKDAEINDYALPILVKDTVSAQSASIDAVSGATLTSRGYLQSLQGALDAAGR